MDIVISQGEDRHVHISIAGEFTFFDHAHFKHITALIHEPGVSGLTLDFTQTRFIDSAGLGMLLLLRDEMQQLNLPLRLKAPKDQVQRLFQLSSFDQLFTLID